MFVRSLFAVLVVSACVVAQEKHGNAGAAMVNVEIHLSTEHAPESVKAKTHANLFYVASSVKTKQGKVRYRTKRVFDDLEVVSVKRTKKPSDPDKAVVVVLRVTKKQAATIEKLKMELVSILGTDDKGGRFVKMSPVPLRLETVPAKE